MTACSERLRVRVDATLNQFAVLLCLVGCSCTGHRAPPKTAGMKIEVAEKPRRASVRYASSYPIESHVFQAESVLITLAVARTVARIEPIMTGGLNLSVMPGGDGEVGLRVTIIEHSSLKAWSQGAISDREFVSEWTIAAVTKE